MNRNTAIFRKLCSIPWVHGLLKGSFRPKPVEAWEMLIMRILFAWVVWQTFPINLHYPDQPVPNGIARWSDLSWLSSGNQYEIAWLGIDGPVTAMQIIRALVAVCLVIYGSGFLLPLALPILTAASILVRTYYNSQGAVHHGCQMVTLILLFQTLVVWYFAAGRTNAWIRKKSFEFPDGLTLWSYVLYYSQAAIAGAYVIAGLTKVVRTSGMWFWNSPYMALEVIKTEKQQYYSHLDETVLGTQRVYAEWMLNNPNLARLCLGGGVILEIFCIFMLFSRNAALAIGAAMILFHRSVAIVMDLHFRFNEYACWIFCVNVPFWVVLAIRHARGKARVSKS